MRSLINFLIRYNNIIIFLLLEVLAVYMLATNDGYHNIMVSNRLIAMESALEQKVTGATRYFRLKKINDSLVNENLALRNRLENVFRDDNLCFTPVNDTVHKQQYYYTSAVVINQSANRQKNYLTLDKGSRDGIEQGMAVVGPDGIAGSIIGVSPNFSVAMSVLNLDFRLSARFKKNGYYGSLVWDGTDKTRVSLNEIPHHVDISVGDTIETSGYSSIFPAGILIGLVESYDREGGDFSRIEVTLATDFNSLTNVYIIGNLVKAEQLDLEQAFTSNN